MNNINQNQFQYNVSEWIIAVNQLIKELKETQDDTILAIDEDLHTLGYQHQVIKDLRKRVIILERKIKYMEVDKHGRNSSEEGNRPKQVP